MDLPVFISREENTHCLLNGERFELLHLDMIMVYDMEFIFYQNFKIIFRVIWFT